MLTTCISKIADLDADVRVRGRRGATFPSQLGYGTNWDGTDKHQSWIQSQEDYEQQLSLRFLSDKEVKISLLMDDLMAYLSKRIANFQKYESSMPKKESIFLDTLLSIFEERIFCQIKPNFLQYIPLFLIAHSDKNLEYSELKLPKESIAACNLFT